MKFKLKRFLELGYEVRSELQAARLGMFEAEAGLDEPAYKEAANLYGALTDGVKMLLEVEPSDPLSKAETTLERWACIIANQAGGKHD